MRGSLRNRGARPAGFKVALRAISAVTALTGMAIQTAAQVSQSIRHVENTGVDHPLSWAVEERFRLGPANDGPESFFRPYPWTIAADARGRVYVLDVGDARVAVFAADGLHIRDLGRSGGGPGEFLRPVGLTVTPEGVVLVADAGKLALVRFDSAGTILEQQRLDALMPARVAALPNGLVVSEGSGPLHQVRLRWLGSDGSHLMAEVSPPSVVRFPDCRMMVQERPYFAPALLWATGAGYTVVGNTPSYEFAVFSGPARTAVVRRDVPPIAITRQMVLASRSVRNGRRITWPGGECRITPEQAVGAVGFAEATSPIDGLAVAPSGELWVQRRSELDGPTRIDVFDAQHRYLGTLPDGFPFPAAFQSDDRFLVLRGDADGVPYVVGYALTRE
jgi:hypothetical protein